MLDVENVKMILQTAADKQKESLAKLMNVQSTGNKNLVHIYERRYFRFRARFGGMCDMLYELGYLAWCDDNYNVFVEKRVDNDM